jgi:hypothetical protein
MSGNPAADVEASEHSRGAHDKDLSRLQGPHPLGPGVARRCRRGMSQAPRLSLEGRDMTPIRLVRQVEQAIASVAGSHACAELVEPMARAAIAAVRRYDSEPYPWALPPASK